MKNKTTKQIVDDINKKIDGLTHDIKTLEGFASSLLALRLELNDIRENFRNFKNKTGCKYQPTYCEKLECGFTNMINRESER